MDYIQLLQKRIQSLNESKISNLVYDEYFNLKDEIIRLQIQQIQEHDGFDDGVLKNRIKKFEKGTYSASTQLFADLRNPYPSLTRKPKGELYNFTWSGDFLANFRLKRQNKGLEIYSTGTGSGDKREFFEGYSNMFGLDSENTATIESEVLYYVLEKTLLHLYQ